jgi:hypothetical protein
MGRIAQAEAEVAAGVVVEGEEAAIGKAVDRKRQRQLGDGGDPERGVGRERPDDPTLGRQLGGAGRVGALTAGLDPAPRPAADLEAREARQRLGREGSGKGERSQRRGATGGERRGAAGGERRGAAGGQRRGAVGSQGPTWNAQSLFPSGSRK